MLLRDCLDDAVADVSADLTALVVASRKRGLSIRRRRRAIATVGTAAAVVGLAVGAYTLVPGAGGHDGTVAVDIAAPVVVGPLSGQTAPTTSRGVAAALAAAVDESADGTFGHFQGAAYDHESFAALLFRPSVGSGPAGQVMVNLQPLAGYDSRPYRCHGGYLDDMEDCAVRRLPNGDTLRTYHQDDDTEFGGGSQRFVAEVLSPRRGLRVVVNGMNTNPWADGEMRDAPVLATEQLTEVATRPWWSLTRLPVEYVGAGERLEDFAPTDAAES